jgi:non-heme chloroperoxidase
MVRVARNVRLHYLDFGGNGPSLIFLAGLGNTAHAFDDFAPAFTDRFHVIALTRRGFGESDHPNDGFDNRRLVEDIRAAMDALHIVRASFIGHSIAGEELTRLAATHPDRVDRIVYLDAAYDRVRASALFDEVFPVPPDLPQPPTPSMRDTVSAGGYVDFVHRTRGLNIPAADIRARYRYDGWDETQTVAYQAITPEVPDYAAVRAPALAIYAITDRVAQSEPWQRADTAHAEGMQHYLSGTESVYAKVRAEFRAGVKKGQVLEIHGAHHWVFVSNRDEVLRAVRRFLLPYSRSRQIADVVPRSAQRNSRGLESACDGGAR